MACVCAAIAAAAFQKTHLKKNREPTHDVDFLVKQSDSIRFSILKKIVKLHCWLKTCLVFISVSLLQFMTKNQI